MNNCRILKLIFKNNYCNIDVRLINEVWNKNCMKIFIESIKFNKIHPHVTRDFVRLFDKYFVNICVSFESLWCLNIWKDCSDKIFNLNKFSVKELLRININLFDLKTLKNVMKRVDVEYGVKIFGDFKINRFLYFNESFCEDVFYKEYNWQIKYLIDKCVRNKIFLFDIVGMKYIYGNVSCDICGCKYKRKVQEDNDSFYAELIYGKCWKEFVFMFKRGYLDIGYYIVDAMHVSVKLGFDNVIRIVVKCGDLIDFEWNEVLKNDRNILYEKINLIDLVC